MDGWSDNVMFYYQAAKMNRIRSLAPSLVDDVSKQTTLDGVLVATVPLTNEQSHH